MRAAITGTGVPITRTPALETEETKVSWASYKVRASDQSAGGMSNSCI